MNLGSGFAIARFIFVFYKMIVGSHHKQPLLYVLEVSLIRARKARDILNLQIMQEKKEDTNKRSREDKRQTFA